MELSPKSHRSCFCIVAGIGFALFLSSRTVGQNLIYATPVDLQGDYFTLGDVDGDGLDDIGVTSSGGIQIRSGSDGSVIRQHAGELFHGAGVGDVNADGIQDIGVATYAVISPQYIGLTVWSGADLSLLHHVIPQSGVVTWVDGVGDLNGDGYDDVAAGVPQSNIPGYAFVISGFDGSVLLTLGGVAPWIPGFGGSVHGVGDVNGDGTPDVAVTENYTAGVSSGAIYCFSGTNGVPLWTLAGPFNGVPMKQIHRSGDVDGDGKRDILFSAYVVPIGPTTAFVISGTTGAVIRSWSDPGHLYGPRFVGDIDSDGHGDVSIHFVAQGYPTLHSGLTGNSLGAVNDTPLLLAGGDVNGDGTADILAVHTCTSCQTNFIYLYTLAQLTPASAGVLSPGCGPQLHLAPLPRLGVPWGIGVLGAQPQSAGFLFASATGSGPLSIGTPCPSWMDLNSVFPLFPLTTDANGNWYQVVLIPHHPAYAGLMLRIQAAVASPLSLTNAIELTLGY